MEIDNLELASAKRIKFSNGRTPVILTKYREQAKYLFEQLKEAAEHVFLLYGDNSDKENSEMRRKMKEVPIDKSMILVATGQKIGKALISRGLTR